MVHFECRRPTTEAAAGRVPSVLVAGDAGFVDVLVELFNGRVVAHFVLSQVTTVVLTTSY